MTVGVAVWVLGVRSHGHGREISWPWFETFICHRVPSFYVCNNIVHMSS